METVLVFGDQLDAGLAHLAGRSPGSCRVLIVESRAKLAGRPWHRQRVHLHLTALRRFAAELSDAGHLVDHRSEPSFGAGLAAHRDDHGPDRVVAMEPNSRAARRFCTAHDVDLVESDQFLCHHDTFAAWAEPRRSLKMEDFYRFQRQRLDVLMDGDDPLGGRWNFDHDNREPPPRSGHDWPVIEPFPADDIDEEVTIWIDDHLPDVVGRHGEGWWPTSRSQALQRLDEFVSTGLDDFGPYEDAMVHDEWKLAHSCLSSSLNLGLLRPAEVVDAVVGALDGGAALQSVEGFVRQVIGWREYVWGLYWHFGPDYAEQNHFDAERALPAAFTGAPTKMRCLGNVLDKIDAYGWAHHIERLMVIGNLTLTTGADPAAVTDWMWERFVDGAEWVMVPNVIGMALHADGGRMATKPYASGGAYINRMSDHCRSCPYDPRRRHGDDACPFTSLYWDFHARHRELLAGNHRLSRQLANLDRLSDLDQTRERAAQVVEGLLDGEI